MISDPQDLLASLPPHEPREAGAPHILQDVLVVDLTHYLAGPLATMMLADLGATVVKVEKPGRGDDFRYYPPMHPRMKSQGAPFAWCNRGKKGLSLDLKNAQGRELLEQLIARADVLVENFSTGVAQGLGLDYASCRRLNPQIVYCSISAYGRAGEFADRNGYDPVTQAESGFMSTNGHPDRDGVRTMTPVMDIHTGTLAYASILGALYHKARTGEGQYLEMSLYESAVQMTGYTGMQHLFTGREIVRNANVSMDICPAAVFKCSDRAFYINCGNDKQYHQLAREVLGRPELADSPRYATGPARMAHKAELMQLLEDEFRTRSWTELGPRFRAARIPCGEVRSISEQVQARESREMKIHTRIPHHDAGWMPNFAPPVHFARTPVADPEAPPDIGQHNDVLLSTLLNRSAADIQALREQGAFGAPSPVPLASD